METLKVQTQYRTKFSKSPVVRFVTNQENESYRKSILLAMNSVKDANFYRICKETDIEQCDSIEVELSELTAKLTQNQYSFSHFYELQIVQNYHLQTCGGRMFEYPLYKMDKSKYYLAQDFFDLKRENEKLKKELSNYRKRAGIMEDYLKKLDAKKYAGDPVEKIELINEKNLKAKKLDLLKKLQKEFGLKTLKQTEQEVCLPFRNESIGRNMKQTQQKWCLKSELETIYAGKRNLLALNFDGSVYVERGNINKRTCCLPF